ncbi:FAD-dependent oxidoreductase [Gulosibacter macacae]|uniref:FAD-dependent oxidoreductase n=1 Tax=Gulosibacter macacae TaxID=2488791 RepID=A0A3P3VXI4_9MICO|nr:FAD-dependent oxidoreductase [Gulosibacter macacae]RRJ87067.1 FAD-dependent oxidoreductase [Gulosibacter macacae]
MTASTSPRRVAVVGAGVVGLSTAWFLQERDIEVTVIDRTGVAAGSSWGNAGWLTPGIAIPLPEVAVLRYGLRTIFNPAAPLYVPLPPSPQLINFLLRFARNCTNERWQRGMAALIPINGEALPAFDDLAAGGVTAQTREATPFITAFRSPVEREPLLDELSLIRAAGQDLEFESIDGAAARDLDPALSNAITAALVLHGQRFLDPAAYTHALADAVTARGGTIRTGIDVPTIADEPGGVVIGGKRYDAAVIATGARLGELARPFGVRTIVQAGRGYSFSVPIEQVPPGPLYFPAERVACTPIGDRLRVAGMMEFRSPDAPLDQRRIRAIVNAANPLLRGADFNHRRDEWVGSRPVTPSGLPLIGATNSPHVFVAGGHGMWGFTLGPATGRLLAEQIATGRVPAALAPFDPLR